MKLAMNEGSLLRRTVIHVLAFVIGTTAFLAISSLVLTTVLKSVLSPESSTSAAADDAEGDSASAATSKPTTAKPAKPPRKKRPVLTAPAAPTASPDDE
ncbi:MAG: hypothetical protein IPK82_03125 [Polyangiaceae bacterium]|nr:hypothetical protein [Polyangiaceae bacterium]